MTLTLTWLGFLPKALLTLSLLKEVDECIHGIIYDCLEKVFFRFESNN